MTSKNLSPVHVAIIMDGNGRWAKKRGLPRIMGHKAGAETVERVMEAASEAGVKILTLYSFSTENWKRPEDEVKGLFILLERYMKQEVDRLIKNNIRLNVIGRISELPGNTQDAVCRTMELTKKCDGFILNLAINYGGRAEIIDAVRKITDERVCGKIAAGEIDEALFSKYLYSPDIPDPELVIRTSGEYRISNFLLWQISYAELYITDKLWPDFSKSDFNAALDEFKKRKRRFGR